MGYKSAKKVITGYENKYAQIRKAGDSDLGYRDMNSRFLNLEKQSMSAEDWQVREIEHKARKRQIEREWHQKNDVTIYVQIAGQTRHDDTDARYYAPFDLKILEIFLKNSARGRKENSDEYNSVVTDLEIYNLISSQAVPEEKVSLLENLQSSCETYISGKHPISRDGKKRKAMITQVSEQVNLLLADARIAAAAFNDREEEQIHEEERVSNFDKEDQINNLNEGQEQDQQEDQIADRQENNILQEAWGEEEEKKLDSKSIEEMKDLAYSSYRELEEYCTRYKKNYLSAPTNRNVLTQNEYTIDILNTACKVHFRLISMDLKGEIELTDEERKDLDTHMKHIFIALNHPGGVDESQSDIMSTRFFNAIGWSEHKPRICKNIDAEMKKFPNRVKMFHTIANNSKLNMENIVSQVIGNKRQYYSFGCYGLGLYTAAREQKETDDVEHQDLLASEHSWLYGDTVGSVQFTFTLNEHAKVIERNEIPGVLETIKKKYPQACDRWNFKTDFSVKYGTHLPSGAALLLAFMGYNTIWVKKPDNSADAVLDYYCTTDRKALSTSVMLQRQDRNFERTEKPVMDYKGI